MTRRLVLLTALSLAVGTTATGAKERYNVWAKEKVRYHFERVQRDPYNAQLRVVLANAYYKDGNLYGAARELETAIELEPDYPEAHCNLAVVRHAQHRVAEAETHYRQALRLDSTLVDATAGLGTLLCATGRRGEGIELLEAALQREARRDDARYNLGVAYHRVGDFVNAVAHLQILYASAPEYPGVRRGLAQACFARGLTLLQADLPGEALTFLRRSRGLDDSAADVCYAEGLAHLRLEDLAAAERAFRATVALEEDHVPALQNLATVLERTGRADEARAYYERVTLLMPHLDSIEAARNATYDETVFFQK